ncbi:hypothetical protein ACIPC1_12780 [Streptomyces sp. NPDC087263]|uniref:hypothetical protein n=1 Tax=Streptomyces sp. NPDC087263 TaxID=3365773 RepID=UPI00380798CD
MRGRGHTRNGRSNAYRIEEGTILRHPAEGRGLPPTAEPYTQPRSTHTWDEADVRRPSEG